MHTIEFTVLTTFKCAGWGGASCMQQTLQPSPRKTKTRPLRDCPLHDRPTSPWQRRSHSVPVTGYFGASCGWNRARSSVRDWLVSPSTLRAARLLNPPLCGPPACPLGGPVLRGSGCRNLLLTVLYLLPFVLSVTASCI